MTTNTYTNTTADSGKRQAQIERLRNQKRERAVRERAEGRKAGIEWAEDEETTLEEVEAAASLAEDGSADAGDLIRALEEFGGDYQGLFGGDEVSEDYVLGFTEGAAEVLADV